jgi:hypothetical protein
MNKPYNAVPCPCGDEDCREWVIDEPELYLTRHQAIAVANLLNGMEHAYERRMQLADKYRRQQPRQSR